GGGRACGEGGDELLVGLAPASHEMLGVEARIAMRDGVETGGNRRSRLRDTLPSLFRIGSWRRGCRRLAAAAGQGYDVVVGAAHGVARGIGIIGRALAAGALAQHAAQAEKNEHRQRQENDGVDIKHVALALGCRGPKPRGSSASPQTNNLRSGSRFPRYYVSTRPI